MTLSRTRRYVRGLLVYGTIIAVTLLLVDGVLIALGLFPPVHDYGDADLGWRPARATGRMEWGQCIEFSAGETVRYRRNEDGIRTSSARAAILADSTAVTIAVSGDSHTELCAANEATHPGVLETALRARGVPALVLPYGAGRYSPLQAYLAFRTVLRPYHPRVFVLNVYTGNDFYDMLRVDDRPHFVPVDSGYRVAPPVWFALDDPATRHRSRVLFAARTLADKVGVRSLYFRLSELRRLGVQEGGSLWDVLAYMRDIWKAREPSIGYADALTAQMLNQQLFFHRFPAGEEESLRRMQALMVLARRENPGVVFVMSPLPSYQLAGEQPVDSVLLRVLDRLPISYAEGVGQERRLYERLRSLAQSTGWWFVDNLAALHTYQGSERLYNDFDYHLLPAASALIGQAEAALLVQALHAPPGHDPAAAIVSR